MRLRDLSLSVALAGLIFTLAIGKAQAATVFTQGPPPASVSSFNITDFRLADDFTLDAAANVNQISFYYTWGLFGDAADLSSVSYAIYANSAGALGTLLQSETALPYTSVDQSGLCGDCALATFAITQLGLLSGDYWLEIHAGDSLSSDNGGLTVFWIAVDDNATPIALYDSTGLPATPVNVSGSNQYSFTLEDTSAVPEPTTMALAALGLAAGLCCREFRKRR